MRRRNRGPGRAALGATLAVSCMCAGLLTTAGTAGASPLTVALFVSASATGSTGCTSPASACKTIQDAVGAAGAYDGDAITISVAAGTYPGGVTMSTLGHFASFTVVGAGAGSTTVTGGGSTADFVVTGPYGPYRTGTVTIAGMAIDGGLGVGAFGNHGGGVWDGAAHLTLTGDTFTNDTAETGAGVYVNNGTTTLTGDTFSHDTASANGAGVFNAPRSTTVVTGATFSEDRATTASTPQLGAGAGLYNQDGTLLATHSTFTDDSSATGGGAVLNVAGTTTLTDDTFSGNSSSTGGAIYNYEYLPAYPSTITLTDDSFISNTATGTAGGVLNIAGTSTLVDDTFSGNTAAGGTGGGAFFNYGGHARLAFQTFSGNSATGSHHGGGVLTSNGGTTVLMSSILDQSPCFATGGTLTGSYDVATTGTCDVGTTDLVRPASALDLASTPGTTPQYPAAPPTFPVTPPSAAIDVVPAAACAVTVGANTITTDERGAPRPGTPGQSACDAGAYEYQGANTTGGVDLRRVFGATADATAAAELGAAFLGSCPGTAGDRPVVVATDRTYADALSSAYLAKWLGTGVLLTPTAALSAPTESALRSEGITHVYVVGGALAVSSAVVAALEKLPVFACGGTSTTGATLQVTRIAGTSAADTAAAVATFAGSHFVGSVDLSAVYRGRGADNATTGASSPGPTGPGALRTAIVASDKEFQDAEAGSVLSYAQDLPVLLSTPATVPAATTNAISALGIRQVLLLGGPMALATPVVPALEKTGVSVLRVAGTTESGTSVELAQLETASAGAHQGFGWDTTDPGLALARGNGFADGLAGAALAARGIHGSGPIPLLLTQDPSTSGPALVAFLRAVGARGIGIPPKQLSFLLVLGGPDALSPQLVRAMVGET